MSRASAARLVLLAAIWGASFLFVRIAAPVIGPVATADLRMLIGGGALAAYYAATGFDNRWQRWWPHYLAIGALNCAAPFLLYGYAALALTAGLLAVLNATSPWCGAGGFPDGVSRDCCSALPVLRWSARQREVRAGSP